MKKKIDPRDPTGGNTKPRRIQIAPSKKWCFTLNNWIQQDVDNLMEIERSIVPRLQFSSETGDTGTPHLQGWLEFAQKKRPQKFMAQIMGHSRMHWEKMRGSIVQNIGYCSKDDQSKIQYGRGLPKLVVTLTRAQMRENQLAIADLYIEDEDPLFGREIHWYWEKAGAWGKSILTKYMVDQMGAIVLAGANKDCLHGIADIIQKKGECPRIIIFDIPRVNQGHISYNALESIKNGCFFSPKYESAMVRFNSPHIIVFSNEQPDIYSLSMDRWAIKELT